MFVWVKELIFSYSRHPTMGDSVQSRSTGIRSPERADLYAASGSAVTRSAPSPVVGPALSRSAEHGVEMPLIPCHQHAVRPVDQRAQLALRRGPSRPVSRRVRGGRARTRVRSNRSGSRRRGDYDRFEAIRPGVHRVLGLKAVRRRHVERPARRCEDRRVHVHERRQLPSESERTSRARWLPIQPIPSSSAPVVQLRVRRPAS